VSNINFLTGKVGWKGTEISNLIAWITAQLAAYKEEGVALTPSVFICNSVTRLIQIAGAGEHIALGNKVSLEIAGPALLKAAAPLCSGNWKIYIERLESGESCNYGVFCGSSDPSSLTIDEIVMDEDDEQFAVIRIIQNATNKVEVRTNTGDGIEFRFNDDPDIPEIKAREHVRRLAKAIARNSGPLSLSFAGYVERVLSAAIRDCHGTLVAVVPCNSGGLPEGMADILIFNPPFHLYDRFQRHTEEGKSASSISRLQVASELVSGLMSSDGIAVFNDSGYILGFRAFIKNNSSEKQVAGGARSRAYQAMKSLVGSGLSAVFFRSQDGKTDFYLSELENQ